MILIDRGGRLQRVGPRLVELSERIPKLVTHRSVKQPRTKVAGDEVSRDRLRIREVSLVHVCGID